MDLTFSPLRLRLHQLRCMLRLLKPDLGVGGVESWWVLKDGKWVGL